MTGDPLEVDHRKTTFLEAEEERGFADTGHAVKDHEGTVGPERLERGDDVIPERLVSPLELYRPEAGQFEDRGYRFTAEAPAPAVDEERPVTRHCRDDANHGRETV